MAKVTTDAILEMNRLYYKEKNYSEVARQTGFSAATVRKYVDKSWTPPIETEVVRFDVKKFNDNFSTESFMVENLGELCVYTGDEHERVKELWKELII